MRETQSEEDGEIQAFRKWISSTQRPGIGGSSHVTQCGFIPPSALKEYMGTNHRVEYLLTSLFGKEATRIVDPEFVREHYLRALAILLLIGQGRMIKHFVQYRSLQDHRLPYRTRPEDFPSSSDPKFFARFHSQQWQFCAADLEYNMNLHLHKEEILPITHKEKIGSGGNAVIYKIVVDADHNKLVPQRWKMPECPPHLRNTFVLKTYRGPDAKEQHRAEHDAFMKLRRDSKPPPFIIAYYGSFVDDDTYNIILEYADRGNFEDFMKTTPAPSTGEEMIEFWDRFCRITHGLAFIHGIPGSARSSIHVLLGWHQDIKPANILVFSGRGTSSHEVYFKVADLSLCHFKQSESLQHEDSDLDAFGTRAYGAPETFRPDDTMDSLPVQVRPDVDIWSMGCVFSEAAVWSRFGWNRVLEYRRHRRNEIMRLLDQDGEHFFHDGQDVLEIVQDIHDLMTKRCRLIDHVTVEILRLINEDMLLNKDEPRSSAQQVFHKSRRIIKATRKKFEVPATQLSPRKNEDDVDVRDPEERPQTPPYVPPGYVGGYGASSRKQASTGVGTFSSARPLSKNNARSHSPSLLTAIASSQYHSRATNGDPRNQEIDSPFGSFRSDSIGLHNLPDPPSPASSYQSPYIDRSNTFHINTQDIDHPQGSRRLHRGTVGKTSHNAGSMVPDKVSLRRSQAEKKPSNHPRRHSAESFPGSFSDPPSPVQGPDLSTPSPSSSSDRHHPKSSPDPNHQFSEIKDEGYQQEPERPRLFLEQGLSWKEEKKKRYQNLRLDGQENLTYLNERDHIFVIDNTTSMLPHRTNVLKVVSLLTYIVKDSDPNGLDVFFTQSTQRVSSGKSKKLLKAVSQVDFKGISNMRARLSHILQEHKDKFGTTTTRSGPWYKKAGPPEKQRALSFYVLTDGNWQPNDVDPTIKALVNSMRANQLPKEHVGIQFISFGEDPRGIARLNHLDHGLGLKAIDMDIVDTTPWNGNIWKQLLGALNSWYDDDPD